MGLHGVVIDEFTVASKEVVNELALGQRGVFKIKNVNKKTVCGQDFGEAIYELTTTDYQTPNGAAPLREPQTIFYLEYLQWLAAQYCCSSKSRATKLLITGVL